MLYQKPWIRCTPYLIGLLVGYGIAVFGKRRVRLHWALSVVGWLIALGIASACLFSTNEYDKGAIWTWVILNLHQNIDKNSNWKKFQRLRKSDLLQLLSIPMGYRSLLGHCGQSHGMGRYNYLIVIYSTLFISFQDQSTISCLIHSGNHLEDFPIVHILYTSFWLISIQISMILQCIITRLFKWLVDFHTSFPTDLFIFSGSITRFLSQ